MSARRHPAWLPLLASLALAACGGLPGEAPPRAQLAIDFNNRAVAALARADYPVAERFYLQAIEHERAIENSEGAALNLLGLALTYQRAGQADAALRLAQQLCEPQQPALSVERRAEAGLLAASLLVGRADWPAASEALRAVQKICPDASCRLQGRLLNLQAQLAIVGNRLDEAFALALKAGQIAEAAGDAEEEANALRTQANSRLFRQPGEGVARIARALEIDRKLALSGKIFKDLALAGRLQLALGQSENARQFYARARRVAQADRNAAALRELALLEQEMNSSGDSHENAHDKP